MVQRYEEPHGDHAGMRMDDDGWWVQHDDYAALEAERDELKERFDNFVRDCGATCWTCGECGHSRDGRGCLVCENRELAAKVERLTRRGFEDLTHDNRELKRSNEDMAARLRAVREANDEGGDDIAAIKARRFVIRQILDGPVPECRACAEAESDLKAAQEELLIETTDREAADLRIGEAFELLQDWRGGRGYDDSVDADNTRFYSAMKRTLARHAADEGWG